MLSLLLAVLVPLAPVVPAPEADAVTFPSGLQTGFQIDGDKTASGNLPGAFDWDDFLKPPPTATQDPAFDPTDPYTTAGGFQSSGIFEGAFFWDGGSYEQCDGRTDPTATGSSQTADTNPWVATAANVQDKNNLCSAGYAVEALSDDEGQRHFILYGYFTRRTGGTADASTFTVFEGPEPGRCDDLMLDIHWPGGTTQFLEWTPSLGDDCANPNGAGTWSNTDRTVDFAFAMGQRTEGPPVGNNQERTFAEYAIDLTAAGLFGDDECSNYSIASLVTRSSDSLTSNMADIFNNTPDPMEISNCGTLSVSKETPTGTTDDEFGFTVTNDSSQGVVVPPDRTSIVDTLRSGQTKTYQNVLSSNLLHLTETSVPPPWQLSAAECTYIDKVGVPHSIDVTDPATPFILLGGGRTDCVLTNDAALVTVTKETVPDWSEQEFDFGIGPDHSATLGNGESSTVAVPAGTPVAITESEPGGGGWTTPTYTCTDGANGTGRTVTVTPVLGENVECTFTNTQRATVTIEKRVPVENAGTEFSFSGDLGDFTLTPTMSTETVASDSRTVEVDPGDFSVTETPVDGFELAALSCWDPPYDVEEELPVDPPTASFTARPGSQVTCSFENIEDPGETATLIVQKATTPMVEWDLGFPFAIEGPDGFEDAEFELNTVADDWSWIAQNVPAGDYTITEEQLPGWSVQDIVCQRANGQSFPWTPDLGEGTVTATLEPGAVVTCLYTNAAALAGATLTKTTENIAGTMPWSFDVSLSPAPGNSRTLSGTGPGTASTTWADLVPGNRYVIREAEQPSWTMGAITCTDQDGAVEDLDSADLTFTFDAEVGQQLECGMTNSAQPSTLTVDKVTTGLGPDYEWSFQVQILPLPEGATNPRVVSGVGQSAVRLEWENLVPGQRYEVTEIDLPDEVREEFTCTGAESGTVDAGNGFWFVAPLGGAVSCTVTNFVERVPATLEKTTSSGDGDFSFELQPISTGEDPTVVPVVTTGGSGTGEMALIPGVRYSLTEVEKPGWIQGEIVCTVTPGDGGDLFEIPDVTDFAVSVGDTVSCEVENDIAPGTVAFTKTTAGITSDLVWSFPVSLTPEGGEADVQDAAGTGPGSTPVAWEDLDPGRYTLVEGGLDGWDAGPITCESSAGGIVDADPAPGYQLDVEAGESYTCRATNTAQPAAATIAKRTSGIGDGIDWSFDFTLRPVPAGQDPTVTLEGSGPGVGDDTHTWTSLQPGAVYNLSESAPGAGWRADGITCEDADGVVVDAARLVPAPGANYTCVADNSAVPVTGGITKTSVGGDGTFAFELDTVPSTGSPTSVPVTTSGGTGSADLPTLLPGTRYSLTEAEADGWTPTDPLSCTRTPLGGGDPVAIDDLSDFTVDAGDAVACAVENTRLGRVVLYKEVHGTGDDPRDFDFTTNLPGYEDGFTVEDVRDDGRLVETVFEDVVPGTEYFFDEDTDPGDPPTLLADLACTYGGEDHSGTPEQRDERRMPFEVLPGETTECYFTNAVAGSIILIKRSIPANFRQDFDFTFEGPEGQQEEFVINSDPSVDGAIRSWTGLVEGEYTLTEEEMPDGWTLNTVNDATSCNTADGWTLDAQAQSITIDLDAADVVTCFFSNRAATASVRVTKAVEGLTDGTAWEFPLTLSPGADVQPSPQQTVSGTAGETADTNTVEWTNLTPGRTYTLAEPASSGWSAGAYSCTDGDEPLDDANPTAAGFQFVAGVGQSLECTLTNTAQQASVAVTKTVSGVAPGLSWSFQLNLTPAATPGVSQTVSGTGSMTTAPVTWTELVPGTTYTLTETTQSGWSQGIFQCPGVQDAEPTTPGFQFVATPGLTLQCGITNAGQASQASVVKAVTGVADDVSWAFPVTISPAANPSATQTLRGTGSTTSSAVTWTALVPGVTYTLTEAVPTGWTGGVFACTRASGEVDDADPAAPGFQFVAALSQNLSCVVSNAAAPAEAAVTKTVSGVSDDLDWEFDVTLTPPGAPEGTRTLAGTGNATSEPVSWGGLVPGTTYTLAEDLPDGWTGGQVVCAGVTDADTEAAGFQFVAALGQRLTCDVANAAAAADVSVTKTVSGVADGLEWEFDVTLTPPGEPEGTRTVEGTGNETSDAVSWDDLVPGGTYTLAEDLPDGWTGGEFVCLTGGEPVEDADAEAAGFQLVATPGQSLTCDVANAAAAADVSMTKTVSGVADDLDWEFDVSLTPPGEPEGTRTLAGTGNATSEPVSWEDLVPGATYTLAEDLPDGWAGGDIACDGVEDADTEAAGFQLVATAGMELECDVANAAAAADVSVTKTVSGVADDLEWEFNVTLTPPGAPEGTRTVGGTGNATSEPVSWGDLVPGETYTLAEDAPDGWTGGVVVCEGVEDADPDAPGTQLVPQPGESLACAVENAAQPASLSATKTVNGVADDLGWTFDLTLTPPGEPEGMRTVEGTGNDTSEPAAWEGLVPGTTYTLTEDTGQGGWTFGGFVCRVADPSEGEIVEDADDAPGFQLVPAPGVTYACDVVNTRDPGTGTITKSTLGGDGDFAFVLTPRGGTGQTVTVSTSDGEGTAELPALVPGTFYSLAEEPADGWMSSEDLACTVTPEEGGEPEPIGDLTAFSVEPGDVLDCTATNARLGRIVVVKAVDGADAEFGFTGSWLDPEDFTITTSGGTGARTFEDVAPGEYTLGETGRPGYEGTRLVCTDGVVDGTATTVVGLDATIGLDPGEVVTCAYSNTEWGVLVVDKETAPASDQEFGFTWGPAAGERERFTLADTDDPFTTAPLRPGAYTVAEDGVDGWQLTDLACTGSSGDTVVDGAAATVDVRAGDTVLCRFTNARSAALTVEKTVVSGPVDRGSGVFEVGYRVVVANPGGVASRYDLADRLRFGAGIEVASADVASPDVRVNPGWDGIVDTAVVAGATIGAGATHSFDVVVTARVPGTVLDAARICQGAVGEDGGSGFLNTATLSSPDGADVTADACVDVPPVGPSPSPSPSPPPSPSATPTGPTGPPGPDTGAPAPDAGPGGPLPVTGLGAGIAGLALALLLAGVALVLVRRRRG